MFLSDAVSAVKSTIRNIKCLLNPRPQLSKPVLTQAINPNSIRWQKWRKNLWNSLSRGQFSSGLNEQMLFVIAHNKAEGFLQTLFRIRQSEVPLPQSVTVHGSSNYTTSVGWQTGHGYKPLPPVVMSFSACLFSSACCCQEESVVRFLTLVLSQNQGYVTIASSLLLLHRSIDRRPLTGCQYLTKTGTAGMRGRCVDSLHYGSSTMGLLGCSSGCEKTKVDSLHYRSNGWGQYWQ